MDKFELNKKCEVCEKPVPDSFVNLLCMECYTSQAKEIEAKKIAEEEEKKEVLDILPPIDALQAPLPPQNESKPPEVTQTPSSANNGIKDPNYVENPEMEDKNQVQANIALFMKHGLLLWHPTRTMYEFIKNHCIKKATSHPQYPKMIWKPTIVDVGCGSGVGSNILSQEADFVWGIDKNEQSVKFAQEAFTRVKNGIYYNSQVTFDHIDLLTDNREKMKFDIVVAIEVIEHIADYRTFLNNLIKFDSKNPNNPTEYFISTPNRNNKSIRKDRPYNPYHVREFTSQEFYDVLSEYFKDIELFSAAGEPTTIDTTHTPLLARCKLK